MVELYPYYSYLRSTRLKGTVVFGYEYRQDQHCLRGWGYDQASDWGPVLDFSDKQGKGYNGGLIRTRRGRRRKGWSLW